MIIIAIIKNNIILFFMMNYTDDHMCIYSKNEEQELITYFNSCPSKAISAYELDIGFLFCFYISQPYAVILLNLKQ